MRRRDSQLSAEEHENKINACDFERVRVVLGSWWAAVDWRTGGGLAANIEGMYSTVSFLCPCGLLTCMEFYRSGKFTSGMGRMFLADGDIFKRNLTLRSFVRSFNELIVCAYCR